MSNSTEKPADRLCFPQSTRLRQVCMLEKTTQPIYTRQNPHKERCHLAFPADTYESEYRNARTHLDKTVNNVSASCILWNLITIYPWATLSWTSGDTVLYTRKQFLNASWYYVILSIFYCSCYDNYSGRRMAHHFRRQTSYCPVKLHVTVWRWRRTTWLITLSVTGNSTLTTAPCFCQDKRKRLLWPLLLIWFNLNPSIDKWLHAQ